MARTSHELRAPLVAAGDALWRDVALARFPCLKSLLELVPTSLPFKSLYRKQLAAVSPQSEDSFPDLSAYDFTVELAVPAIGWSAAWSAPASSFTVEHGNGHTVYSGWDKICKPQLWTDATRPERLTKTCGGDGGAHRGSAAAATPRWRYVPPAGQLRLFEFRRR